uniref:Importin subunit alpha n=1 Tax=Dermatophagoides pteronyssinus TaxID=6956 RepID=A0A6P6Y9R2_DERPT|nr:importin subunit alpha-6-like [Dermatophagoides pteronyssinus]
MLPKTNQRCKDFKNAAEDPLRRRENEQFQIRKAAREAQLAKRRGNATHAEPSAGELSMNDDTQSAKPLAGSVKPQKTFVSEKVLEGLFSSDDNVLYESVQTVRRSLSNDYDPPIQTFIDIGLVEPFIKIMRERTDHNSLRFEAAWTLTNVASGSSSQTSAVVEAGGIAAFGELLDSGDKFLIEQSLWGLGNIAGDCRENRGMIIESGVIDAIIRETGNVDSPVCTLNVMRYGIWSISNMCRGCHNFSRSYATAILDVVVKLITYNDPDLLGDTCWCVYYLLDNFMSATSGSCVGTLLTGNDDQTEILIRYNCVPLLRDLLDSPKRTIRKEACWAISNIAAGTVAQVQELFNCNVFAKVCEIFADGDFESRREAAWTICNAANGATVEQIEELVRIGVIPPLCAMLASHEVKLVHIMLEAARKILESGVTLMRRKGLLENPFCILFEEANAFEYLEDMQYWDDKPRIQSLAVNIIQDFLDVVEDEEVRKEEPAEEPAMFGGMM